MKYESEIQITISRYHPHHNNPAQETVEVYENTIEADERFTELKEQDDKSGGYQHTTMKLAVKQQ